MGGRPRLNNEIIDERLSGRNIIRVDDYVNCKTKMNWKCLIHDFEWPATTNDILRGYGCPKCGNVYRYTIEDVKEKLEEIGSELLGEYKNVVTKMKLRCKIHDEYWENTFSKILQGRRCPFCAKRTHVYTNEIVDKKLIGRNIKRLSSFISTSETMEWECLIDGYKWKTDLNSILGGNGCSECSGKKKRSYDEVVSVLKEKNIQIIKLDYNKGNKSRGRFKCLVDGYEWGTAVNNIINSNTGCARCSNCEKLNNSILDERLKDRRDLERIGNYVGIDTKIKWKCKKCGENWDAIPYTVLNGTGCPICKNKREHEIFSYVKENLEYDKIIPQYKLPTSKFLIDMCLINKDKLVFIEVNGKQHYEPVSRFGGVEQFIKQEKRDEYVRDYSIKHNIELIEIHYKLKDYKTYIKERYHNAIL